MRTAAKVWILIVAWLIVLGVFAQTGAGRLYDPSTEVTLQGRISKVSTVEDKGRRNGVHLALDSQGKIWDVRVGPSTFIAQSGVSFAEGDQIEVVGSRVQSDGSAVLIAREITRNGRVLTLRDRRGIPNWSGAQRGTQGASR